MISTLSSSSSAGPSPDASAAILKFFSRLDTNHDGKISAEEFAAGMQQRFGSDSSDAASNDAATFGAIFKQLDSDGDGQINQAEFKTGLANLRDALRARSRGHSHQPDPKKIFGETDADGSGTVSVDEMKARFAAKHPGTNAPDFAKIVSQLDQNGDGELNESEFPAMRPPPPTGADGGGVAALFSSIDTDHDGVITLQEFAAALAAHSNGTSSTAGTAESSGAATSDGSATPDFSKLFAAFDSDGDGKLSQAELEAMFEQTRRLEQSRERIHRYDADGAQVGEASTSSGRLDVTA